VLFLIDRAGDDSSQRLPSRQSVIVDPLKGCSPPSPMKPPRVLRRCGSAIGKDFGAGCASAKNSSQLNLDELIAVAERCDAEQSAGCRERWADARTSETVPHARQHARIVAGHVDHRPNDVLGARPRCRECFGRVGGDLIDLGEDVAASDETRVAVERALPGKHRKPAGINKRDVGVASRPVQPLRVESGDDHPMSLHSALDGIAGPRRQQTGEAQHGQQDSSGHNLARAVGVLAGGGLHRATRNHPATGRVHHPRHPDANQAAVDDPCRGVRNAEMDIDRTMGLNVTIRMLTTSNARRTADRDLCTSSWPMTKRSRACHHVATARRCGAPGSTTAGPTLAAGAGISVGSTPVLVRSPGDSGGVEQLIEYTPRELAERRIGRIVVWHGCDADVGRPAAGPRMGVLVEIRQLEELVAMCYVTNPKPEGDVCER